jgi:hypothetical protein
MYTFSLHDEHASLLHLGSSNISHFHKETEMKTGFCLVLALTLILLAGVATAQPLRVFEFQAFDHKMKVEILPEEEFEAKFGKNPEVPRTHEEIIALAEKLYPPRWFMATAPEAAPAEEGLRVCGTHELGVLMGALQNPAITDDTRVEVDRIIQDSVGDIPFKPTITMGEFVLHYTDVDTVNPSNNVTEAVVDEVGKYLKTYYQKYTTNFTKPNTNASGKIDVWFYQLSGYDGYSKPAIILLDSPSVMSDSCNRESIAAHELFHEVQFSYGLIPGSAADLPWISEATAMWSEKWMIPQVHQYMKWMNYGLETPYTDLFTRTYDACNFWIYLMEQAGTIAPMHFFWTIYALNLNNLDNLVNMTTTKYLKLDFWDFLKEWNRANYLKDLTKSPTYARYGYKENKVTADSCKSERLTGLEPVLITKEVLIQDNSTTFGFSESPGVSPRAADYWEFDLDRGVTQLNITVTGPAGRG